MAARAVAAAAVFVSCGPAQPDVSGPSIELELHASWRHPVADRVSGGSIDRGTPIVWDDESSIFALKDNGIEESTFARGRVIARNKAGPYMVAADPLTGELLWTVLGGRQDSVSTCLPFKGVVEFAVLSNGAVALVRNSEGGALLVFVIWRDSGRCDESARVSIPGGRTRTWVSGIHSSRVVVSSSDPHISPRIYQLTGGGVRYSNLVNRHASTYRTWAGQPKLMSLPFVDLGRGMARVTADLRGSKRLLELWDSTGSLALRHLDEPWGIVAANDELLLAVLPETDRIALYRWRVSR